MQGINHSKLTSYLQILKMKWKEISGQLVMNVEIGKARIELEYAQFQEIMLNTMGCFRYIYITEFLLI